MQPLFVVLAICNAAILKKRVKLKKKAFLELSGKDMGPKSFTVFFLEISKAVDKLSSRLFYFNKIIILNEL